MRVLSKVLFTIRTAAGVTIEAEKTVREYLAPKSAAVGTIDVEGTPVAYRRTGGVGRGTVVRNYLYFSFPTAVAGKQGYIDLSADEAAKIVGATLYIRRANPEGTTAVSNGEVIAEATEVIAEPTVSDGGPDSSSVVADEYEPSEADEAPRRLSRRERKLLTA